MSNRETVTAKEAAVMLGIDIRTVRDWINKGHLKSIKGDTNRRRVLRESIGALNRRAPPANRKLLTLGDRYAHGFKVPEGFDLITTYSDLTEYTRAFAKGDLGFLLLVGSPGSGKSQQLHHDLAGQEHQWIDNHCSLLGLYCSVYEAKGSQIVLDDINHLLRNPMACSLLKALTQTDRVRWVSWESTAKALEQRCVPRRFSTSSSICLTANKWDSSNPDMAAIQDRSTPVAFYPSAETIHKRVLELGWCDETIWKFIGKHLPKIPQPSMREYQNGMTYKKAGMKWQEKLQKRWAE
jgi:hypothetical protein